jgi:hypothetical protein
MTKSTLVQSASVREEAFTIFSSLGVPESATAARRTSVNPPNCSSIALAHGRPISTAFL